MTARYLAIYDADGTLSGELGYALGKLAGTRHCALCDISHGWNPAGKAAWRKDSGLSCSLQWLHRDEQSSDLAAYTLGKLPLVVEQRNDGFRTLLDAEKLEACNGDYEAFLALLEAEVPVAALAGHDSPKTSDSSATAAGSRNP
ncbi:MAG: hypothetical protein P8O91_05545 [Luminiphilus sp.]|nr:hypothetical protein [Luminiphilus sp.]